MIMEHVQSEVMLVEVEDSIRVGRRIHMDSIKGRLAYSHGNYFGRWVGIPAVENKGAPLPPGPPDQHNMQHQPQQQKEMPGEHVLSLVILPILEFSMTLPGPPPLQRPGYEVLITHISIE